MGKGQLLGEFEICVLLGVARLDDAAYGIRVGQQIEARTGRRTSLGAVYSTLSRLEEKGLVAASIAAPKPVQGGRSRKVYRLTASGTRALDESLGMLKRMMAGWRPQAAR
jgi:PadR family transcriptional regulator